ncbi:MAG: hypothetical protein WA061_02470 [Microgenomates group bacterium]
MTNPKIVSMDADGFIINLHKPWLGRYNYDWNDDLTVEEITEWGMHKLVKPECGTKIYEYIEDPTIYDEAPPIDGAIDGIRYVRDMGYRIVFVTSSTLGASGRKYKWFKDYGLINGLSDYVEMSDKSLIRSDYLFDDYQVNISGFIGKGVLYTQPWNKSSTITPRVFGWLGVLGVVKYLQNELKYG